MAVDVAGRTLDIDLDVDFCTCPTGDGGVVAGNFALWKRGMVRRVNGKIYPIIGLTMTIGRHGHGA